MPKSDGPHSNAAGNNSSTNHLEFRHSANPSYVLPQPETERYLVSGLLTNPRRVQAKPRGAQAKTSRENRYNRMCVDDLQRVVKVRGIRLRDVLINALIEQDRLHAEHPFPFLRLPAELRNQIYAYIVVPSRMTYDLKIPVLARVSSQVRRESLDVFFGRNPLSLSTQSYHLGRAPQRPVRVRQELTPDSVPLLRRIRPHIDYVRKVLINVTIRLKRSRKCSMRLALERCINRTPQYVASTTLDSGYRFRTRSPMKNIMESIKNSVQESAQAHLDQQSSSFSFSANDINSLLDTLPAWLKVVIDEDTRSVTLSNVEGLDSVFLEVCNCRRQDLHEAQCTESWIRSLRD
ncbi:hypothetical protein MBLNU457_g0361t2 [Dothideomycetes sp. NU457]